MNGHVSWETLNDYADGVLDHEERGEASRHFDRCDECRARLSELRSVRGDAGNAASEIEAPDEVWPALRAELEQRKVVAMRGGETGRSSATMGSIWVTIPRRTRWTLAAAAAALVVASSAVTGLLVRGNPDGRIATTDSALSRGEAMTLEVAQVERGYLDSVVELTEALESARPHLAPATIAVVEKNLAMIDAAITESKAAMLRDPGNRILLDVLAGTYRQKLDLLRRAAQLVSS